MLRHRVLKAMIVLGVLSSACSHGSPSSMGSPIRISPTWDSASPIKILTPTSIPTNEPSPTTKPSRIPPVLPGPYQTSLLNPLDTPHTYLRNPCQYLHDKWSTANSVPGTVVMVIMFHQITNQTLTTPEEISEYNFRRLMKKLHDNGFQAITTLQMAGFMERNSRIPERSVLLVTDDKHTGEYYNVLFRQYWTEYGWPVVNAWISDDLTTANLWKQQETLNAEGWVDYQAHGVVHTPIDRDSSDKYILGELQGSINAFKEHFNKTPIAIIWPGGGFTARSVRMARQLGYQLGFTINPRGPLMFNWVPLDDSGDPTRDAWIPEGSVNDPLMVLPRYWDTDASLHLNEVIQIGQEAATNANANRSADLHYYDIACSLDYGAIP